MSVDLHIHSTMSDGTLSPSELVELARKKGLSCIAITDHDTVAGYAEAKAKGDEVGLDVISGVELSVTYSGGQLHLLGYLIDCDNITLLEGLRTLHSARDKRNGEILEKLKEYDIDIKENDLRRVSTSGETGRPHIAKLLIQKGVVSSMDQAFDTYLGREGCAYVERFVFDLEYGIDLIHKAGGIAVIAHPVSLLKDELQAGQLLEQFKRIGLDGIEVYYPTHSRKMKKQLIGLAKKYGLVITGGSDYHGSIRKGTTLAGGKGVSVPEDVVDSMRQLREQKTDLKSI